MVPDVNARFSMFSIQWFNREKAQLFSNYCKQILFGLLEALGKQKLKLTQLVLMIIQGILNMLTYDYCNNCQTHPFSHYDFMQTVPCVPDVKSSPTVYHPFWSPSVKCPLNWLQSKVWIDRAWVNWPRFQVPEAFRQGACLPSWCLIQGPRWRCNSLAVRSLTHTFTRRGCGSGGPRGDDGVRAAPPALHSQYNRGQCCHSEPSTSRRMDGWIMNGWMDR